MSVDHQLALVAEQQYGLLTSTKHSVRTCRSGSCSAGTGSGHLQRVKPGVYRIGGAPVSWRQHLMAAVLAAGPGAVASHRAAAVLKPWVVERAFDDALARRLVTLPPCSTSLMPSPGVAVEERASCVS